MIRFVKHIIYALLEVGQCTIDLVTIPPDIAIHRVGCR
eukprot:XP_001708532.1 Hypothetical protein GL50803_35748 [Giardia lamblia ATCC 50803]